MTIESEIGKRIKEALVKNEKTSIIYYYFDGVLEINDQRYHFGQQSFSQVANAVLNTFKRVFGAYRTIPYTFNSEAYENDKFKAEVLALGGLGLLEFSVYRKKQVVE